MQKSMFMKKKKRKLKVTLAAKYEQEGSIVEGIRVNK